MVLRRCCPSCKVQAVSYHGHRLQPNERLCHRLGNPKLAFDWVRQIARIASTDRTMQLKPLKPFADFSNKIQTALPNRYTNRQKQELAFCLYQPAKRLVQLSSLDDLEGNVQGERLVIDHVRAQHRELKQ